MATTSATSGTSGSTGANKPTNNEATLNGLNLDDFLKLLIAEMQNQDPLNPMENSEMLQQISQIREIGATDQLTTTLDSVLLGQNVANATALIGKSISGLDDKGGKVDGIVDRVSIANGKPRLHIGTTEVSLSNVADIKPQA